MSTPGRTTSDSASASPSRSPGTWSQSQRPMESLESPPRLRRGDVVAAVSLSSGLAEQFPARYEAGTRQAQSTFCLQLKPTPNALRSTDWLYRNPKARAEDLMAALEDDEIKAIICTIGGTDSIRVARHLDPQVIAKHPKAFIGFSDATVTHFCFLRTGIQSFYGPCVLAGLAENCGITPYTKRGFEAALFTETRNAEVPPNHGGWANEFLDWGVDGNQEKPRQRHAPMPWRFLQGESPVQGPLIGGCADVLELLKGTHLWPPSNYWQDSVLFLELSENDVSPTIFESWMRNYGEQGILSAVSAIIMGRPGFSIPVSRFAAYDKVLLKVLAEYGCESTVVVTRFDIGHTEPMWTLPYGAYCCVDPRERRIRLRTEKSQQRVERDV